MQFAYKILLSILLNLSICTIEASAQEKNKKETYITAIGPRGWAVYIPSIMYKARDLSFNLQKVIPFFKRHPEDFEPISHYILSILENTDNKVIYNRYKKLAELMLLENIPDYDENNANDIKG